MSSRCPAGRNWHNFGEVNPIRRMVRACLYFPFSLSLRLVEEMLLERGIVASYETIRR